MTVTVIVWVRYKSNEDFLLRRGSHRQVCFFKVGFKDLLAFIFSHNKWLIEMKCVANENQFRVAKYVADLFQFIARIPYSFRRRHLISMAKINCQRGRGRRFPNLPQSHRQSHTRYPGLPLTPNHPPPELSRGRPTRTREKMTEIIFQWWSGTRKKQR